MKKFYKLILTIGVFLFIRSKCLCQNSIPVFFRDYDFSIDTIPELNDTIIYEYSGIEKFKVVFFDYKGKCYMERYLKNKLQSTGYYESSLDTLKRYISGRSPGGKHSYPIEVQCYFEPLKHGLWTFKKNNKIKHILYNKGLLVRSE